MNIEDKNEIQIDEIKRGELIQDYKVSKGKLIITSIIKLIYGFYMIGFFVGLNELILPMLNPILESLYASPIMTKSFTPFVDFLLGPIRLMPSFLLWFLPITIMEVILFYVLSKVNWLTKKELKIYFVITVITCLLMF